MSDVKAQRGLLLTAALCVWGAVVMLSIDKYQLAARSPMSLSIATKPENIRLRINNRYYRKGYLSTPLKLEIPSGSHRIRVSREGYISHVMTVQGTPGDHIKMEGIVLEKNTENSFFTLHLVSKDKKPLYFDLNEGLAFGEAPKAIANLKHDSTHTLTVYPDWPKTGNKERCTVTVGPKDRNPYKISISRSRGKIKFSGCRKVTRKRKPVFKK